MAEYENIIDLNKLGRFHNNLKDKGLPLNDWQANKEYKVDCTVIQDGKLYRCKTEHTSTTTFDDIKWSVVSSSGIPYYISNISYKVDDQVVYDNKIYKCVTAHTSTSTFDDTKWEEISGGGILAWKSNKNYKVGIMVVYKYCIYMCKVAHTSTGEFDYSKWIIIGGNGNSDFGDYVGHITWQMSLQSNYLKLDGTPLANASNDYDELLKYAQDNNLITADTTDKSLFKYDSTNDVLTLPDYIGLCLQGGNSIEEKEAGLPNIKAGVTGANRLVAATGITKDGAFSYYNYLNGALQFNGQTDWKVSHFSFDASDYNAIYSDSVNTVQPPAIQLIPQIRYKYSGCVYSTEEQRIGTWIDGKPLYQKTVYGTYNQLGNNTFATIGLVPDFLQLTNFVCYKSGDDSIPYNFIGRDNITGQIWVRPNGQVCCISNSHEITNGSTLYATIQYTKTTD